MPRGNLTTDPTTGKTYGYTPEDLLNSGTPGVTLYYDPLRRLVEYDTTVSTRFVYDGPEIAAEVDNPAGAILHRYVRGDAPDEVLVDYTGPGTAARRWLHADERGSIVATSNASGAMLAINRYDEFGKPQSGNAGRFQYTGQMWLAEIGLYHYKARAYAPHLGRFLQTDPIGYDDGINWYAYVGNDPVNGADPTGTCFENSCPLNVLNTTYNEAADDVEAEVGGRALLGASIGATGGLGLRFGLPIVTSSTLYLRTFGSAAFRSLHTKWAGLISREFNRGHYRGLARAIKKELSTGKLVGGKSHLKKGKNVLNWIGNRHREVQKSNYLSNAERQALLDQLAKFEKDILEAFKARIGVQQ